MHRMLTRDKNCGQVSRTGTTNYRLGPMRSDAVISHTRLALTGICHAGLSVVGS